MAAREALWSTPRHMNQVHIWWHKALFHLELGQYDAALALYDGPMHDAAPGRPQPDQRHRAAVAPRHTRLRHRDRWAEQADLWQDHADGKCLVVTDIPRRDDRVAVGPGGA